MPGWVAVEYVHALVAKVLLSRIVNLLQLAVLALVDDLSVQVRIEVRGLVVGN